MQMEILVLQRLIEWLREEAAASSHPFPAERELGTRSSSIASEASDEAVAP